MEPAMRSTQFAVIKSEPDDRLSFPFTLSLSDHRSSVIGAIHFRCPHERLGYIYLFLQKQDKKKKKAVSGCRKYTMWACVSLSYTADENIYNFFFLTWHNLRPWEKGYSRGSKLFRVQSAALLGKWPLLQKQLLLRRATGQRKYLTLL